MTNTSRSRCPSATILALAALLPVSGLGADGGAASSPLLPLPNPGFEDAPSPSAADIGGWTLNETRPGMIAVCAEAAHEGKHGLRITDDSDAGAAAVFSTRLPAGPGRAYRLTFLARVVSGNGIAVNLRFLDAGGRYLNAWPAASDSVEVQGGGEWRARSVEAVAPEGASVLDVWIHSYVKAKVTADFDEVSLAPFVPRIEPPWPPVYKINPANPADAARMTPADVAGPDGLVYPDWRHTGIPGGIPERGPDRKIVAGPQTFAARAGQDIAPLINDAIARAAAQGGGVIELPPGEFLIESPVVIRDSGIVLRGAGRDRTRLVYQEHIPFGSLRLYCWGLDGKVGPDGFWEVQANPKNLVSLRIDAARDGRRLAEVRRADHWGNRFSHRLRGSQLLSSLGPGRHRIKAEAGYSDGRLFSETFELEVSSEPRPGDVFPGEHGAFVIAGPGPLGPRLPLVATALRGDNKIRLAPGHGLKPGDQITLEAPPTPRWNKLTGASSSPGVYRINHYEITAIGEERPSAPAAAAAASAAAPGASVSVLTIDAPLRLEFPLEDGAFVQRIRNVGNSGFEDFCVEQKIFTPASEFTGPRIPHTLWYPTEDLWADGVTFTYAWRCWARGVRVVNSGRNPVYITRSRQCELRGMEAEGAIFKGGGGSAYVGFERSFDCLMDGIRTKGMRHAPNVQWGSAGNVIRNGHFIGSDAQWHAGWTNENLYENNIIEHTEADRANGATGNAFFASGPLAVPHGPQGPRNVVYNNDVSAPRNGVHMLGGNEAWLILHNRFRLGGGLAVFGRDKSFDHTIRGNVFIMEKPGPTGVVFFNAPECTGIDVVDNRFYGPVKAITGFRGGLGRFGVVSGNTIQPLPSVLPARPRPAVPSIYEWQLLRSR
ncbi:MAG: endopolygalacturonase [Opitutaceae bacterium]|jgi:hypothetical protein|nr:endopolygalacturonase [Opitutaceae bacterium]